MTRGLFWGQKVNGVLLLRYEGGDCLSTAGVITTSLKSQGPWGFLKYLREVALLKLLVITILHGSSLTRLADFYLVPVTTLPIFVPTPAHLMALLQSLHA